MTLVISQKMLPFILVTATINLIFINKSQIIEQLISLWISILFLTMKELITLECDLTYGQK